MTDLYKTYKNLVKNFNWEMFWYSEYKKEYANPNYINDGIMPWWEEWTEPRDLYAIHEDLINTKHKIKKLSKEIREVKDAIKDYHRSLAKN